VFTGVALDGVDRTDGPERESVWRFGVVHVSRGALPAGPVAVAGFEPLARRGVHSTCLRPLPETGALYVVHAVQAEAGAGAALTVLPCGWVTPLPRYGRPPPSRALAAATLVLGMAAGALGAVAVVAFQRTARRADG
jgi:hypothetical protein